MVITLTKDKNDKEKQAALAPVNRPRTAKHHHSGTVRYKKHEQLGKFIAFPLGKGVFLQ